jgi:hypothetical protein
MARVAASLDIRPRRHIGREASEPGTAALRSATLYRLSDFPELVREAGFDPAISRFQGRRIYPSFPTPCLVERAGRLELPCLLIRNQAFIQLNYARILEGPAGHDPASRS